MQLYDFETWFTLLTGFAIFTMGLRVFWLDSNNRMYQAFMIATFLLFAQNLFFFLMGQTTDLDHVLELRAWQESTWNVATFFIGITMWFYARQFIPRLLSKRENNVFYFCLGMSLVFIYLEGFTSYGHGSVLLNSDNKWAVDINETRPHDWLRMLWTAILYGMSIYFSYLPFKYSPKGANTVNTWLRGSVFAVFSVILIGTFIQNYILTIFFQIPSTLNESINVAIGALFGGLMIINLQLNDLHSDYAIPNLLKTMTNWFVLTDRKFNIRRTNAVFLENMGQDISYWQNQSIYHFLDPEEWKKCQERIAKLGYNEAIEYEFRVVNRDKIYYILFAITPVYNRAKMFSLYKNRVKAYAFVGTNLSQFKASENKTKAYAKELEASVQALESFAFIASHDLKEPIRNIGSFATLLKRRLGEQASEEAVEYIGYIEDSVKNMNQLVNSIMDISRIGKEGLDLEKIDMNKFLLKKQEQMKRFFEKKKAQLMIENLPSIQGDPQLISQLFQNLIENSIKYNITTSPYIRIYTSPSTFKGKVLIKVADNGIGIEKEYREQVFQMFKRLHSRKTYEGTGIGLAICKRIMEIHQGEIWIEEPDDGSGTIFVMSFPREG